jgi:hypothetical protein
MQPGRGPSWMVLGMGTVIVAGFLVLMMPQVALLPLGLFMLFVYPHLENARDLSTSVDSMIVLVAACLVVAIPIICRVVTRRFRWYRVALLTAVLVIPATIYWFVATWNLPLDTEAWKLAAQTGHEERRYRMVRSVVRMIEQGRIHSTATAAEWLGDPDTRSDDRYAPEWRYDLGIERRDFLGLKHCWLELSFDYFGNLTGHTLIHY